jgi:hypothetical protein
MTRGHDIFTDFYIVEYDIRTNTKDWNLRAKLYIVIGWMR